MRVTIKLPSGKKRKVSLREFATLVANLQFGEALILHARGAECMGCFIKGTVIKHGVTSALPARFVEDADWMHRHVAAPSARIAARLLDETRAAQ